MDRIFDELKTTEQMKLSEEIKEGIEELREQGKSYPKMETKDVLLLLERLNEKVKKYESMHTVISTEQIVVHKSYLNYLESECGVQKT